MTFAFCAESLQQSAAVVAGTQPITSPPTFLSNFDPHLMEGHAFLYFKLHGAAGQPYWYGDGGVTAMSADQVSQARLDGALVFASNCWEGADAPMVQALLAAGAAAVVSGRGVNYAGVDQVDGVDVIGVVWRVLLEMGIEAGLALDVAKAAALAHRPELFADIAGFSLAGTHAARLKEVPKDATTSKGPA